MKIGDRIVYPLHGAGIVISIEKEDFFGEEMEFCLMEVCVKDLSLKFPISKSEKLGIRDVESTQIILAAIEEAVPEDMMSESNWNKRYQANLDLLKVGTPQKVAQVLVNLTALDIEKGFSSGERQLYHNAMDILSSEIMLVSDITYDEAFALLEHHLRGEKND